MIKRYTTEIIASEMQLLDGRSPSAGGYDSMQGQGGGYGQQPQQQAPQGGFNQAPQQP